MYKSSFIELMIAQSSQCSSLGLIQTDVTIRGENLEGNVQLASATPEIRNPTYRSMILSTVYKENLVCIAVDEAHYLKLWVAKFRSAFYLIGDLRSIIPLFFFY